jgi:malate dehydrogenase (quinone)
MFEVLRRGFAESYPEWRPRLRELVPSIDASLSEDPVLRQDVRAFVESALHLRPEPVTVEPVA